MRIESSGKPDAWKLARPVWGWGRGETPRPTPPSWIAKLDQEIKAGRVKQAIVVGPANIAAFVPLFKRNGLLLIPAERPKYYDPNADKLIAPPFGSLICYVGRKQDRFVKVFGAGGVVLRPVVKRQ